MFRINFFFLESYHARQRCWCCFSVRSALRYLSFLLLLSAAGAGLRAPFCAGCSLFFFVLLRTYLSVALLFCNTSGDVSERVCSVDVLIILFWGRPALLGRGGGNAFFATCHVIARFP